MPNKKKKLAETDLYQPIHNFLEEHGYSVRSEVKGCDITAVKNEQLIVVEMKLSFNTTLLIQATDRQRLTDDVYIAVPRPSAREWRNRWPGILHLLRRLELGLLLVTFSGKEPRVEVVFDPKAFARRKSPRRLQAVLSEIAGRSQEHNQGGSSRRKLLTAYRESALHLAWLLAKNGPSSPKQLRDQGAAQNSTPILYKDHYGWFKRLARGVYDVSEEGRQALQAYPELVQQWQVTPMVEDSGTWVRGG